MIVLAALCGIFAVAAFVSGESAVGAFLTVISVLWMFAGISEFVANNRFDPSHVKAPQSNMFYNSPMVKEILAALDVNGCYERISFEELGTLRCERRSFEDREPEVYYYEFEHEGEKRSASLEEQCELLKLLKYYLPNGDTYHIQAAYDVREYEAFCGGAGGNAMPSPQYYMMFTEFYDDRRWNEEISRWERI